MQVSVARYLRTPPYAAKRKGLVFDTSNCLRSQSHRSTVVVGNCTFAPITVVAHRAKAGPFGRSSILFRPHPPPTQGKSGGVAGYRPRVRSAYYGCVYRHSPGEPERVEYRPPCGPPQAAATAYENARAFTRARGGFDGIRRQKPALICSNSCSIRSRIDEAIGVWANNVVVIGLASAAICTSSGISAIAASLAWA